MSITFDCPCGKVLRVKDEHAGRRVKCPMCGNMATAPGGEEPEFEVVESESKRIAARRDEDEDDDVEGQLEDARRKRRKEAEEAAEKPRKKKRKRRKVRSDAGDDYDGDNLQWRFTPEPGDVIKKWLYIGGGLLLLCGAIGLVVLGLNADTNRRVKAFVVGGFLCFSALGSIFRGITGNFDDDD
jgi:hypothetical protein